MSTTEVGSHALLRPLPPQSLTVTDKIPLCTAVRQIEKFLFSGSYSLFAFMTRLNMQINTILKSPT